MKTDKELESMKEQIDVLVFQYPKIMYYFKKKIKQQAIKDFIEKLDEYKCGYDFFHSEIWKELKKTYGVDK